MMIYTLPLYLINVEGPASISVCVLLLSAWIMVQSLREIFRNARTLELRISIGESLKSKSNSEVEITRIETIV